MRFLFILFAFLVVNSVSGASDDPENIWMKTFYKTDDVAPFAAFWNKAVAEKRLEKPNTVAPMVAFTSQVLHRHPELIERHLSDLKKIPKAQRKAVLRILWLSDTPSGRVLLGKHGGADYLKRDHFVIGKKAIETAGDLDFCWGWYFATGDLAALDPILSALEFGEYVGALERYPTSKKTEADRAAAIKESIFKAAMWSLEANGREDAKIVAHMEQKVAGPPLPQERIIWLATLLSRLRPETYKVMFVNEPGQKSPKMHFAIRNPTEAGAPPQKGPDLAAIDASLAHIASHARSYPPKFADDGERAQIETELRTLLGEIAAALAGAVDNTDLLFRDAYANAMGHNLDLSGCGQRSMDSYEHLLALSPENAAAHYCYGLFLVSTAAHQKESIPHLEKAVALGCNDALYTLALAELSQGNKDAAIKHLQEYAERHPKDVDAQQMIEHIEKSEVRFSKSYNEAPAEAATKH